MASAQEKMDALVIWVSASIITVTMAFLGTPIWNTVTNILNAWHLTGAMAMSNLHAVQPVPMMYYGFLVVFEIAVIVRTVFVVWSKSTYEQGY